jgi:hypothetical protein
MINFLDTNNFPNFHLKRRFGEWICLRLHVKSLLCWEQSIELLHTSVSYRN